MVYLFHEGISATIIVVTNLLSDNCRTPLFPLIG